MPNHPNHIVVGQKLYHPGQMRAMRDELEQARKTGEFPATSSSVDDPKTIVEDYKHLQRLRDARGNPLSPPSKEYNIIKVDIARRIKARDEAEGSSTKLREMDNRVQGWMNSISKEARMLEITQAALQRKGISEPTQDDMDAIAEEFMQVAERTLLDVANPLRMNASRMAGNISRLDSQLNGLDSQLTGLDDAMAAQINGLSTLNNAVSDSMTSQINGLSTLNNAVNTSMTAQVNTLNTVLTNVQSNMTRAVGNSTEAMCTAMGAQLNTLNTVLTGLQSNMTNAVGTSTEAMNTQINTLNTMLTSQSSNFNGSINMLNTSLNTVTNDLHRVTTQLPTLIAAAVQAAVQEQLAAATQQTLLNQQHHTTTDAPPSYVTNMMAVTKRTTRSAAKAVAPSKKGRSQAAGKATAKKGPKPSAGGSSGSEGSSSPPTQKASGSSQDNCSATSKPYKAWQWSHIPPTKEQRKANGRVKGRRLIFWDRNDMMDRLLVHLDFQCRKKGVEIPWEDILNRLKPGSGFGSIGNRIKRLREKQLKTGYVVPPVDLDTDITIRGYVRTAEDFTTGRVVFYNEAIEEPVTFPDAIDDLSSSTDSDETVEDVDVDQEMGSDAFENLAISDKAIDAAQVYRNATNVDIADYVEEGAQGVASGGDPDGLPDWVSSWVNFMEHASRPEPLGDAEYDLLNALIYRWHKYNEPVFQSFQLSHVQQATGPPRRSEGDGDAEPEPDEPGQCL
ncbi:hypothetical protein C8035_v001119 [Colletotrichum spinosum]|uniref:Uncharacterized protein n=1 Tax=Colletotrichum spinosum TaxID=1347390 RepID=A0A4R8QG46_9PEZI|nr:hypothetical protein C8035_v001119 [Colletotrichum spinosum]